MSRVGSWGRHAGCRPKKSENVASQEACFNEWKLNVNKLLLMMVLENHFFISKHTYSSSIRSRAKASSQDEFSYLEGSDLYACFSSTAQFFSLEALKSPLSIQSVPHIKNGYCNCFHGLYPPWMVEEDQKLWNIKIVDWKPSESHSS